MMETATVAEPDAPPIDASALLDWMTDKLTAAFTEDPYRAGLEMIGVIVQQRHEILKLRELVVALGGIEIRDL
ncbi:hypothetical protein [Pseudonocardia sp.]|uniref:hypothetical protein n=1 Tax=Pseudonocardia sp. TaxID=60912 RepID=UPI00262096B8|nr:hypothetical protein [Pseudonocardia sp.]